MICSINSGVVSGIDTAKIRHFSKSCKINNLVNGSVLLGTNLVYWFENLVSTVLRLNDININNIYGLEVLLMILFFVSLPHVNLNRNMKYKELEKRIKKIGCFDTGKQMNGHPIWHSPKTGKDFKMSNHGSEEVATGTLNAILKAAGLK